VGDVMTVRFFWMVRDEGSWLDIGTSISHFCICDGLGVFVALIEAASEAFVGGVVFEDEDEVVVPKGVEGKGKEEVAVETNGNGNVKKVL
jgi:phosphatidylinositol glycan class N